MPEKEYEKVIIYPHAQFVPPGQAVGHDWKLIPVQFPWLNRSRVFVIHIDEVLSRDRRGAAKAGGHGYCYTCRVSWQAGGRARSKVSEVWFDPRRLQWFVEVAIPQLPEDWQKAYLALGQPKPKRQPRAASITSLPEGPTVRRGILPYVRFVAPDEKTGQDYKLLPDGYEMDDADGRHRISVDRVSGVMRASSLKHTKRGYRYSCFCSWDTGEGICAQYTYLWFDAESLVWEIDVPVETPQDI